MMTQKIRTRECEFKSYLSLASMNDQFSHEMNNLEIQLDYEKTKTEICA